MWLLAWVHARFRRKICFTWQNYDCALLQVIINIVCLSAFPLLAFFNMNFAFRTVRSLFPTTALPEVHPLFPLASETCLAYALSNHPQVLSRSSWAYWWICWSWIYPVTSLPVFHLLFSLDMGSIWRRRLAFRMPLPIRLIGWLVIWLCFLYPRSHSG